MFLNFKTSFTSKKKFKISIYSILCLFLFISCNQEKKATINPNIVWLVAEDQSSEFFPMYGDLTTNIFGFLSATLYFSEGSMFKL